MELLHHLGTGFEIALTWHNILYALVGCLLGTLIGVVGAVISTGTQPFKLPIPDNNDRLTSQNILAGI
jgi:putative tricarboxylic transport membrane protein